ncbi:MAG: ABC transporter substrate-binding protein, partial [Pseudomonadota bacterium]
MTLKFSSYVTAAVLGSAAMAAADCADTVKVGVLHSLSGTMAISETTLKDTMLMLIEKQNAAGGVLGCQIEAVVVDPASDWPLFAEKARELLTVHDVDVIFGNWTSVSRKSVLPVIEELNGLLFYPVQYEGEESSKNVFYTGAAPNQQAIPAVDYFLEELGVEKFALLGTDYVYPRTTNNILEQYLQDKGIAAEDIFVNYTPFGHSDWATIVGDVVALGEDGKQVGVISTINGDANIGFYKELAAADISADDIPVVAFSVGEEELSGLDTSNLVGHLAAWNYFQSADTPANTEFIDAWKAFAGEDRVTNDPMEAHYIGFNMWVNAATEAGTTEVDAVR